MKKIVYLFLALTIVACGSDTKNLMSFGYSFTQLTILKRIQLLLCQ
ncbi:hypothetical protein N9H81_01320 [bacterium]|nr:hypothetical protein [bacterium]